MEERGQTSDESGNFYCLFHPLWIQQWSFDEVQERIEVPLRVVLGKHDLRECQNGWGVEMQVTHLRFQ